MSPGYDPITAAQLQNLQVKILSAILPGVFCMNLHNKGDQRGESYLCSLALLLLHDL